MAGRTVRYQGGSIVSFIIITVIVIAALGVGLHVLRQRSEQARISSTTSQDQDVPAELPGSSDDENTTDSETFPSSSDETRSGSDQEPASEGTENNTSESDAAPTGTAATGSNGSSGSSGSSVSSSVAALPETGPEQLLVVPVLAVIVYVAVAYAGSSRQLADLRS